MLDELTESDNYGVHGSDHERMSLATHDTRDTSEMLQTLET